LIILIESARDYLTSFLSKVCRKTDESFFFLNLLFSANSD
jgi:hypothetical protein